MFATYQTLIGKQKGGKTRLDQLIQWCGGEDFDGLINTLEDIQLEGGF